MCVTSSTEGVARRPRPPPLTQAVAVLVVVVMVGAYAYVHKAAGIYAADGGWELVAVIGLAVAVFGLVGTGRYSVDALIAGRRAARG